MCRVFVMARWNNKQHGEEFNISEFAVEPHKLGTTSLVVRYGSEWQELPSREWRLFAKDLRLREMGRICVTQGLNVMIRNVFRVVRACQLYLAIPYVKSFAGSITELLCCQWLVVAGSPVWATLDTLTGDNGLGDPATYVVPRAHVMMMAAVGGTPSCVR